VSDIGDRPFLGAYVVVSVVNCRSHTTIEFSGFEGMWQDLPP
jgi:hypothetical protein